VQLLVDNRSDSTKMHGAKIRFNAEVCSEFNFRSPRSLMGIHFPNFFISSTEIIICHQKDKQLAEHTGVRIGIS